MSISISPKTKSHSLPSTSPNTSPSPSRSYTQAYSPYMPSPKLGPTWGSPSKSLLPSPNISNSPRRTARRLSYGLKTRLSKHSLPIAIGLFVTTIFLYLFSNSSYLPSLGSSQLHIRDEQQTFNHGGYIKEEQNNGLSFLELEADELIAEDDLFWDAYQEKQTKSKMEQKEMEQMEQRRKEVVKINKVHSLRALVWWISQGGVLPSDWKIPTKEDIHKLGASGMEKMLEEIEAGVVGDEIFQEGWAAFAKERYRVVVFSKTFCPYSKNAKAILANNYQITPSPHIIELDKRTDYQAIQTILQYLTGRRTVPNILLDFISIGGSDDLTLIHGEGGLQRQFQEMGVLPGWFWKNQKDVKRPINMEDLDENVSDELRKKILAEVALDKVNEDKGLGVDLKD